MPTLLRWNGWKFFFYSREGMPPEPPHVHIRKDRSEAKIWLGSPVRIAADRRMDPRTLRMLLSVVEEHSLDFEEAWNDFFS